MLCIPDGTAEIVATQLKDTTLNRRSSHHDPKNS